MNRNKIFVIAVKEYGVKKPIKMKIFYEYNLEEQLRREEIFEIMTSCDDKQYVEIREITEKLAQSLSED